MFHDFAIPAGECVVRLGAWRADPNPLPTLGDALPHLEMRTPLAVFGPAPGTDLWCELSLGVAGAQDWEDFSRRSLRTLFSARFADSAEPTRGSRRIRRAVRCEAVM
ncbi:hypothetical protein LO772_00475 [Yinghuangia sp. ASG 101]|uniref:hypothetical protein n=1 Tax=Yinghuangia sp. ASG 101 TaxID=2896848 RepID=UPI001E4A50C9|nr:hypothetical protein [Yinghuangia sp. ASG 101]UGQ12121.1 hypothetical protein LO772_00475 [Yinghuangia sp. ASG 101]